MLLQKVSKGSFYFKRNIPPKFSPRQNYSSLLKRLKQTETSAFNCLTQYVFLFGCNTQRRSHLWEGRQHRKPPILQIADGRGQPFNQQYTYLCRKANPSNAPAVTNEETGRQKCLFSSTTGMKQQPKTLLNIIFQLISESTNAKEDHMLRFRGITV